MGASANVVCLHNTSEFNVGSCYNATNGRFTPTLAGYYSISANCFIGNTTNCSIQIWKNGVEFFRGDQITVASADGILNNFNSCLKMVVGDYIQIIVFSITATNTLTTTRSLQTFQGIYLQS